MKKQLLNAIILCAAVLLCTTASAQRYVADVFTNIVKTSNIMYDSNRSVNLLYGSPIPGQSPIITVNLKCDVYAPDGDTTGIKRPLVIVAGTGSYLPAVLNRQTTGTRSDSSIVELCTRLAKKGYVAVAIDYRQGWNAQTTVEADAKEQLLKATYRAIQDVRNAIRYFRVNASTYSIDTSKIVVGGQGTGGYVALGVASINKRAEIESNIKFLRTDFSPMVNMDTLGDWNGLGGAPFFNYGGDSAVSGNAHMVFNYGGAYGDSTWIDNLTLPMVGVHSIYDPFAPCFTGNVRVPGTSLTVIPSASGAGAFIPYSNTAFHMNDKINCPTYTDPYSIAANKVGGAANKNLYLIVPPTLGDGAPWEWWDRPTMQGVTTINIGGYPIPASGHVADSLSMLTNPTMSAAKGRAYIDTIVNFVARRIAVQFDYVACNNSGIQTLSSLDGQLSVYPNPAQSNVSIEIPAVIKHAAIFDLTGKEMMVVSGNGSRSVKVDVSDWSKGMYFVRVVATDGRAASKRIVID